MDLAIAYNLTEWKIEILKYLTGWEGGLVQINEY